MDLVDVADVEDSVMRFGDRYLARVYTPAELRECAGGADIGRLAAHFAAKEATRKTLPGDTDGIDWRLIDVRLPSRERATVRLSGQLVESARHAGIAGFSVSVGSTRRHATAVVLAEDWGDE